MVAKFNTKYGEIVVSQRVIAELAGNIAAKCYGIVGMGSRSTKDGIVSLLRSDNMTKGIDVKSAGDGIGLTLHIIVQYGINIGAACESVVHRVKYNVETILGIKVKNVAVKVEGIRVSE